jgi:hypothetical protein
MDTDGRLIEEMLRLSLILPTKILLSEYLGEAFLIAMVMSLRR